MCSQPNLFLLLLPCISSTQNRDPFKERRHSALDRKGGEHKAFLWEFFSENMYHQAETQMKGPVGNAAGAGMVIKY